MAQVNNKQDICDFLGISEAELNEVIVTTMQKWLNVHVHNPAIRKPLSTLKDFELWWIETWIRNDGYKLQRVYEKQGTYFYELSGGKVTIISDIWDWYTKEHSVNLCSLRFQDIPERLIKYASNQHYTSPITGSKSDKADTHTHRTFSI